MNALSDAPKVLKPWHDVVSINENPIEVQMNGDSFTYRSVTDLNNCQGVYAKYDEGVFVFLKYAGCLYIGWQKKLIPLSEIDSAEWDYSWQSRCFKALKSGRIALQADYHTYRRFLVNPFRLLGEILIPDDEWGYVADLPSFIHSIVQSGNVSERFEELIQG